MKTIVLLFLAGCLMISCTGNVENGDLKKINLNPYDSSKMLIEDLSDSTFFIPLNQKKGFKVDNIDQLYITKDRIIVAQHSKSSILIFDREGEPVLKIQNLGKGRGQFEHIQSVIFNEKNQELEIFDKGLSKISRYNLQGKFIADRAIKAGKDIETIYIQRNLTGEIILELKQLLKEVDAPVHNVPVEKLNRMTQKNHQGVIAVISSITFQKIEDIIPMIYEKGETPLVLILDGITDVRNMGAIARTAACAGVHAIVVPTKNSAQINADAIKTSAGALFTIPVCRHANLQKIALFLQECGLQIVACTEKTNDLIYVPDYTMPTAIVMGAEDEGISNEIMRMANHLAKIPMIGEISSLNVSVSAGVILYEAIRQRTQG